MFFIIFLCLKYSIDFIKTYFFKNVFEYSMLLECVFFLVYKCGFFLRFCYLNYNVIFEIWKKMYRKNMLGLVKYLFFLYLVIKIFVYVGWLDLLFIEIYYNLDLNVFIRF